MKKKSYKIPFVLMPATDELPERWDMQEWDTFKVGATTTQKWIARGTTLDLQCESRDVYEFTDKLKIRYYSHGRSSVRFYLVGTDGTQYSATLKAFMDALELANVINETIGELKWTFAKRGSNYTIEPVK